jgi:hypothetical protein
MVTYMAIPDALLMGEIQHAGRCQSRRGFKPHHEVMLWFAEKPVLKAIEHQLFEENESERFC